MIRLILNRDEYRNDVAEEIRQFFGNVELCSENDAEEAFLTITASVFCREDGIAADASDGTEYISADLPFSAAKSDPIEKKRLEKRVLKIAVFRLLSRITGKTMPWGSLTGIRPSKLFREISDRKGETAAEDTFRNMYDVSAEKTDLAARICGTQKEIICNIDPRDIDLYFHIPYCRSRCLYCSFGTELAQGSGTLASYVDLLKREISESAAIVRDNGYRIRCSYFGGGTPSILPPELIDTLLSAILKSYGSLGKECTFEAGRPDTITAEKLAVLREYGINRISINPQTFHDDTLFRIGRGHASSAIEHIFSLARNMGFSHVNMDLIVGLPGESEKQIRESIDRALQLGPENLTIHTLAIKRSSRLNAQLDRYPMIDPVSAENAVRYGTEAAERAGYEPYYMYRQKYMQGNLENVGYALKGESCIYNIDIMEELVSIAAHGAGAISKRVYGDGKRIEREAAPKDVPAYAAKLAVLNDRKRQLFA